MRGLLVLLALLTAGCGQVTSLPGLPKRPQLAIPFVAAPGAKAVKVAGELFVSNDYTTASILLDAGGDNAYAVIRGAYEARRERNRKEADILRGELDRMIKAAK